MPDLATHQRQAANNRQAVTYLQAAGDAHLDWAVTAAFYAALHVMDQCLAHASDVHPRSHHERHAAIGRQPQLASIYADYREWEYQGRRSRYDCATFTAAELQALLARLERISQLVERILNQPVTIGTQTKAL